MLKKITRIAVMMVALFALVPAVLHAEKFVQLDKKAMEQVLKTKSKTVKAKRVMEQEVKPQKAHYVQAMKECKAAEKNTEESKARCTKAADLFMAFVGAQVPHLEKYDKELGNLQRVFDRAIENAKVVEGEAPGSAEQLKAFDASVREMKAWDEMFEGVTTPAMRKARKDVRDLYTGFQREIKLSKANHNRYTFGFLDSYSEVLLTTRILVGSYTRQLQSVVSAILETKQAGVVEDVLADLGETLRGIEQDIVPPFLDDFGYVFDAMTGHSSTNPYAQDEDNEDLESLDTFLFADN